MSNEQIRVEFEAKFPRRANVQWSAQERRYTAVSGDTASAIAAREYQFGFDAWQAALESQAARCPYIETSGTTSWCRLAAQPKVPEGYQLIDNETLRGLASVLGNDFPDCIDNDGQPYQSQYLADLITASQEQPK